MDTDTERQAQQTRQILLGLAAALAHRAVAAVKEGGLTVGQITETVQAGGTTWHLHLTYWHDKDDVVRIQGHPVVEIDPANGYAELPPFLAQMFGGGDPEGGSDGDGRFTYTVPRAWLPGTDEMGEAGG